MNYEKYRDEYLSLLGCDLGCFGRLFIAANFVIGAKFKKEDIEWKFREVFFYPKLINFLQPEELKLIGIYRLRPETLKYINEQTQDLCQRFIDRDSRSIKFIEKKYKTPDLCIQAVMDYDYALKYIESDIQNEDICVAAVNKNTTALKWVNRDYLDACYIKGNVQYKMEYLENVNLPDYVNKFLISKYPRNLRHMKRQSLELCQFAVNKDPLALEFAKYQTEEMCLYAVYKNPTTFEFVKNKTHKLCIIAVALNFNNYKLLNDDEKQFIREYIDLSANFYKSIT